MTTGIKRYLRDNNNGIILPYTVAGAVFMDDGITPISEKMSAIDETKPNTIKIIDSSDPILIKSIGWSTYSDAGYQGGSGILTSSTGATVSFDFVGTGVKIYDSMSTARGIAEVFIDEKSVGTFDRYSSALQYKQLMYSVNNLEFGYHTVKVKVTGTKNVLASDVKIVLDYFEVLNEFSPEVPYGELVNGQVKKISFLDQLKILTVYGAKGDGDVNNTDDTDSLQRYIDDVEAAGGGIVYLPAGKVFKHTGITIDSPYVTITGGGTLLDGTLNIGHPTTPTNLYFDIHDIKIKFTTLVDGNVAISLKNCKKGDIRNVKFENCDKTIYINPLDVFQHVARVRITDNLFDNVNYDLYIDRPGTFTIKLIAGDIHFQNNQSYLTNIAHIYGYGMDGLVCTGNTLFMQASSGESPIKSQNIWLTDCDWVVIAGNNLFEAGLEAIYLKGVRDFSITGNNIAWCGQRDLKSGIYIEGPTHVGSWDKANNGCISGNSIVYPSKHGVELVSCGGVSVIGNTITEAGKINNYYGTTDITSITHYGVCIGSGVINASVTGNMSPTNNNYYGMDPSVVANGNFENGFVMEKNKVLTVSGNETTIDVEKYKVINLNQPSPTTITEMTFGLNTSYRSIVLVAYSGNTTLENNSVIRLKGGVNCNIPLYGVMVFQYADGKWWEASRSFDKYNGSLQTNLNADMLDGKHLSDMVYNKGVTTSNADLNTVIDIGIYKLYGSACTNIPSSVTGSAVQHSILKVYNLTTAIVQELTVTNMIAYAAYANIMYTRVSMDGGSTWSEWMKVVTSNDNGVTAAYIRAVSSGDAVVRLETTGPVDTSHRDKRIYSSPNIGGGNDWLFRAIRPSDGVYHDFSLNVKPDLTGNAAHKICTTYNEPVSKATNGYKQFADGLIIQWGTYSAAGTVNFPIAFTTAVYAVEATSSGATASYVSAKTTSNFTVAGGTAGTFISIGY